MNSAAFFSDAPVAVMDLQLSLFVALKRKYGKLTEEFNNKPILELGVNHRDFKKEIPEECFLHHEFYLNISNIFIRSDFVYGPVIDLFVCDCYHSASRKTILTVGVGGSGKSTLVQLCCVEWAEHRGTPAISCLLPFAFWELNLIKHKLSLVQLLQTFYPELKKIDGSRLNHPKVWFVFDGLNESKRRLDFSCPPVTDVSTAAPVDVLVTNLIRGNLLPRAHVWLTSRYSWAAHIPDCHLLAKTELEGFTVSQRKEHIFDIIGDSKMTDRVMDHMRLQKSLDQLCQIPPICTITANVLKNHLKGKDGYKLYPLSLTQIYTQALNLQKTSHPETLTKLKNLALLRFGEENLMYEEDLQKTGIGVEEASAFSRKYPFLLKKERGLHNTSVFRFGHFSVQEYLAASCKLDEIEAKQPSLHTDLCKKLVEEAVHDPLGKYDVYVRFFFGLLKERRLLKPSDRFFLYTKRMVLEYALSDRSVCLLLSLREYDSRAFLSEFEDFLNNGFSSPIGDFSAVHWNLTLGNVRIIDGLQEHFELDAAEKCDEKLLTHLPEMLKSVTATLRFSNLTDRCCPALGSVLSMGESHLRGLDLGYNSITDEGVKVLAEGLSDPSSRLKYLRLQGCGLSARACKYLSAAMKRAPKLLELDLSCNDIGDRGLQNLSCGLKDPSCRLEGLRLSQCNIEPQGCAHLASALQENPSFLKYLDLSINPIRDEGAIQLSKKFNLSKLHKLEMNHCELTRLSCGGIGEALGLESSVLWELNLSNNPLSDKGFQLLCEGIRKWATLTQLKVSRCWINAKGCSQLTKVLCSVMQFPQGAMHHLEWSRLQLIELDLSMNCLEDKGGKAIAAGLKKSLIYLRTLNLSHCCLSDECCDELASGLASSDSRISELDLSGNELQDRGVKKLCVGLKSRSCTLTSLALRCCQLTSKSVTFLAAALKSNPQYLAELHLMGNSIEDSDVEVLLELIKNQKYALEMIDVTVD
uniref:NACHT domain-containing protein n=1 Tax=Oryzias sinensis TaxID=183150 RepID=A0A8C7ZZA2_9TELE